MRKRTIDGVVWWHEPHMGWTATIFSHDVALRPQGFRTAITSWAIWIDNSFWNSYPRFLQAARCVTEHLQPPTT